MFVGGIVGLINTIKLGNFESIIIVKDIVGIIFASTVTSIGICLSITIGNNLIYRDRF